MSNISYIYTKKDKDGYHKARQRWAILANQKVLTTEEECEKDQLGEALGHYEDQMNAR